MYVVIPKNCHSYKSLGYIYTHGTVPLHCSAVSDVLTNLKGIAGDMGGELDRQNNQLDRLNQKMDVNTTHLEQANYRIRRQL